MAWKPTRIAGGWEYRNSQGDERVVIDYLEATSRGLNAWVEIYHTTGKPPVFGRRDLMGTRSAKGFADDAVNLGSSEVPWQDVLPQIFFDVITEHRTGEKPVDLATTKPEPFQWVVQPLIESGGHTRLIAPGGSGKSMFGLALGLTVATGRHEFLGLKAQRTGPVLYLDWETEYNEHARRMRGLCEGAGVDLPEQGLLLYQRQDSPLSRVIHSVHRLVDQKGVVFVVVDSVAHARGAAGEGPAEDSTLRMFAALRQLGVPALLVDHKSAESMRKGRRGGYGSVFNTNASRMEWEMMGLLEATEATKVFRLELTKHNNVGRQDPVSFRMTVSKGGAVSYSQTESTGVPDDVPEGVAADLIRVLIEAAAPMDTKDLSEATGASTDQVRARLNQYKGTVFENVGDRAKGLWRLVGSLGDEGRQESLEELDEMVPPDPDEIEEF